jgi:hypothetical protein
MQGKKKNAKRPKEKRECVHCNEKLYPYRMEMNDVSTRYDHIKLRVDVVHSLLNAQQLFLLRRQLSIAFPYILIHPSKKIEMV